MLLTLAPAVGAPLTIIREDAVDTGYRLLPDAEWGNAVWDIKYSGQRGTQGARAAGGVPQNRPVVIPIRVYGTSKDNLNDRAGALSETMSRLRRFGGLITVRGVAQTYRQSFVVMGGQASLKQWGRRAENALISEHIVEASCAAYLIGDPMDIVDGFAVDTVTAGYWTFDSGTSALAAIVGGVVTASGGSLSTERRLAHTIRGYLVNGAQATIKATPGSTITSFKAGVILRRSSATTYVEAYVDDDGANSRLRIDVVIAGARTNRSTTNLGSRITAGTPFWVRGRIEGSVVYAEHFTATPTPMGAPTTSSPTGGAGYTLTTGEQTSLVAGTGGVSWIPQHASATLDDFEYLPFTRRNLSLPDAWPLEGTIPGDAPALADIAVTPSGGAAAPAWAMLGWGERPAVFNWCWNGDLEDDADGWSVAAVTGVTGAATSRARDTTAARCKYGTANLQIVCPATANTGGTFAIYRRFRKGIAYTLSLYASSAAAVTNTRCRLGVSGDIASETPAALTATPSLRTVTWTPAADTDVAYACFEITAAIATTMNVDGVLVYEGTTAPTVGLHGEGAGAYPPFGILNAAACDTGDLTSWAITADATNLAGQKLYLNTAGVSAPTAAWWIDPHLLVADDFTLGEIDIEVWARVGVHTSLISPRLTLSARPEKGTAYGAERYTAEWGTTGVAVTVPSSSWKWRLIRLGTITLPVDAARQSRWKLRVTGATSVGSSGDFSLGYLIPCPIRARAASPSGKPLDATFPSFVSTTGETTKTILSDLRGMISKPPSKEAPDSGLDGRLLELPAGTTDLLTKLSSLVPDDTTSSASGEQLAHTATVHAAVTPRWHLFRGA